MKEENMKLTIIIPIYNAETYIKKCLDSVSNCKIGQMECLLIDDGSKDSSASICKTYVNKDSRFHLIQCKNSGVSAARNRGLQEAKGNYVMFLDADDYFTKDAFERIASRIQKSGWDFMAFSYYTLYSDGETKEEPFVQKGTVCTERDEIQKVMLASSSLNTCWAKVFRLDLIREHKITFRTDLKIGEDFVFVSDYFKVCRHPVLWNVPILFYRQNETSAMHLYALNERLQVTDILFTYNKKLVMDIGNPILIKAMYAYYLRVFTNLLLEFSKDNPVLQLKEEYQKALQREKIAEIVKQVDLSEVSLYKKVEGVLLKHSQCLLLACYFKMKSLFRKERWLRKNNKKKGMVTT